MNGKTQVSPNVVKHELSEDVVVVSAVVEGEVVVGMPAVAIVDGETSIPSSWQFSEQNPHLPE